MAVIINYIKLNEQISQERYFCSLTIFLNTVCCTSILSVHSSLILNIKGPVSYFLDHTYLQLHSRGNPKRFWWLVAVFGVIVVDFEKFHH